MQSRVGPLLFVQPNTRNDPIAVAIMPNDRGIWFGFAAQSIQVYMDGSGTYVALPGSCDGGEATVIAKLYETVRIGGERFAAAHVLRSLLELVNAEVAGGGSPHEKRRRMGMRKGVDDPRQQPPPARRRGARRYSGAACIRLGEPSSKSTTPYQSYQTYLLKKWIHLPLVETRVDTAFGAGSLGVRPPQGYPVSQRGGRASVRPRLVHVGPGTEQHLDHLGATFLKAAYNGVDPMSVLALFTSARHRAAS